MSSLPTIDANKCARELTCLRSVKPMMSPAMHPTVYRPMPPLVMMLPPNPHP